MIVGSAVHEAVRMLHNNPHLDIDSLVEQEIENQVNINPNIPVEWGEKAPWDRAGRTLTAIRKVRMYWIYNAHLNVVRHEVWFWFTLPVEADPPLVMRGKIDQIIRGDSSEMIIRELKSGDRQAGFDDLMTDYQVALQSYGLRYGYVALEDNLPYVGEKNQGYHIHEFRPLADDPERFTCDYPNCGIVVERPGIFPEKLVYYDLGQLDPGKTKWNKDDLIPKGEPETVLTPDPAAVERMVVDVGHYMLQMRRAEETGIYFPPFATGFGSPCDGCQVSDHCTKRVCTVQKGNSLNA
jgi:hypothetical protein